MGFRAAGAVGDASIEVLSVPARSTGRHLEGDVVGVSVDIVVRWREK